MALTFTVKFNLDTKKCTFTDTTTYVSISGVTGSLVVTDPDETVYPAIEIDIDGLETQAIFDLPVDIQGEILEGEYLFEYSATGEDPVDDTFEFLYPVFADVTIEMSDDCNISVFTSEDTTNYVLDGYSETWSRLHTIIVPKDSALSNETEDDSSSAINPIITIGPNMWTGQYAATVQTTCTYVQDTDGLILEKILYGADSHTVACDDCQCQAVQCMENLWGRYDAAKGTSFKQAETLKLKIFEILAHWMLKTTYKNCGELDEAQDHCDAIKTILASEDCVCIEQADSYEVLPIFTGGSGSVSGTTLLVQGTGIKITVTNTNPLTYQVELYANTSDLLDVDSATPSDKYVLKFSEALGKYTPVLLSIGDISSFNVSTPTNYQILVYDTATSKWINVDLLLSILGDVNITPASLTDKQLLLFDFATLKWVAGYVDIANILGIDLTGLQVGDGLIYTASGFVPYTFPAQNVTLLVSNNNNEDNPSGTANNFLTSNFCTLGAGTLSNGDIVEIEAKFQVTHLGGFSETMWLQIGSTILATVTIISGNDYYVVVKSKLNITGTNTSYIFSETEKGVYPVEKCTFQPVVLLLDTSITNTIRVGVQTTHGVPFTIRCVAFEVKRTKI
jgi:hypothetical protein